MNIDVLGALGIVVKLIADNSVLVVSGGIVIVIAIIFITITVALIKNMLKQNSEIYQKNFELIERTINDTKEMQKRERDDKNKQIADTLRSINALTDKMEVLFEGINNSFQGLYIRVDEVGDKVNANKELSEEEFLSQSAVIMENSILMVKDVLLLKVEKNHLIEQKLNNIGYDGTHKDGELYDTVMRFFNDAKSKISQLKFYNETFRQKLRQKCLEICEGFNEQACFIFNIDDENYDKAALNTQVRLLANKTLTLIKSMNIDNL